ncbi:GAF domain-containing protein [Halogranum amylolyticum]|uniref:GAF domain-containing protein n=1 Tax=Halogranum amylolyticum TaxID=660520 RepID=A0A1H8TIB3_9EURY|nr:bacterio-opsin activator domain-containing protein [Halogranum amylolyticum]SEO90248.1 GAF domain-containing protein [Halogranum amylolyticum]
MAALVRLFDTYQEIQQAVIQKPTTEEIDQVVCESLVESDWYAVAWVCNVSLANDEIHPRAAAGGSGELIDEMSFDADAEVGVLGRATIAAASSGEIRAVHVDPGSDQLEALPGFTRGQEYRWVIAIPLTFEGVRYGVLTTCSTRENVFEDHERTALKGLGRTVGHAINATRWKQAFVGDNFIGLDIWLPDMINLLGLSDNHGSSDYAITVEGMIPVGTSRVVQYLAVTGLSPESFREAMTEMNGVETVRQIDNDGDNTRFEVTYDDFPMTSTLTSYGGRIKTVHFDVPDLHITVALPLTVDVRQLFEALQSDVPDLKLGAQRTVHRDQTNTASCHNEFEEDLTDRQRTAVLTAFHAGYFEWPRESTAEEVATTLNISSPTFHYHLRLAQRKILSKIFECEQQFEQ